MNTLIFCSFEVGALPYNMAKILNRHQVPAYYLFLGRSKTDHDSTHFHFGGSEKGWNITESYNSLIADKYRPRYYLELKRRIYEILKEVKQKFNITRCFSTGYHSHLLKRAGINYNYWSYGADLDQMCFFSGYHLDRLSPEKILRWLGGITALRNTYRKSIQLSDSVFISPYQHESLLKIKPDRKYFFLPHIIKTESFEALKAKKISARQSVCNETGARRYFFSASRHFWSGKRRHMADNKGNDITLKAFSEYIRRSGDKQTKLVLVEKGPDVEMSRRLAKELGIDNRISWIPEMKRENIIKYYKGAAFCFGQFGTPVLTYTALEPLSMATPCVSHFNMGSNEIPYYSERPPIYSAFEPEKIAGFLDKCLNDPIQYEKLCADSYDWIYQNCSEAAFVTAFTSSFE